MIKGMLLLEYEKNTFMDLPTLFCSVSDQNVCRFKLFALTFSAKKMASFMNVVL